MASMLEVEIDATTGAVENTTAPVNLVNNTHNHARRMGARSETCTAAPHVGDVEDSSELIDSFKSLCVDDSKDAATPAASLDEDSSEDSDSDWYTSDNDEGQTKAYPPFSKFGGYSFKFDSANVDWKIINRRYFMAPGANAVPWWFCWGVDPGSEYITYLYRVDFTVEISFHQHRTFHHFDANDGPCPRDLGYHFFQPTRAIYRQNDTGTGYEPVPTYEEQAGNSFHLICQAPGAQGAESPTFPGRGTIREPTYQPLVHGQQPMLFQSPSSSQGTSLQSSPYSLDGDFSSMGLGTPLSSPGAPANWSPTQEMAGSSQGSGIPRQLPAASESSLFLDPPGTGLDNFLLRTYHGVIFNTKASTATRGASSSITGHAGGTPALAIGSIRWPEDEDQVMRIAGLETESNVDTYLGNFVKILKEKQITEVYCWDCKHGQRGRSIEQCKQNCTKLSSLKRHVMGHLKINTFSCPVQGCTFNSPHKDNLTRHAKEYHAGSRRPTKDQTTRGNRWNPLKPARGETIRPPQ